MHRTFTYRITPADAGQTILQFLTARGYSRAIFTHLKRTPNGILLNQVWAYVTARVQAGDTLTVRLVEESDAEKILPISLPLDVRYEDEDLLIVNKPAGMPIHPSKLHQDDTLANAVLGYYKAQGISCTFRCISRLDRDTTGLVLLAKHMLSASLLGAMMRSRDIHREYLAIVHGTLPECGTICAPIARVSDSGIKRQVDSVHGESAITHYRRLACGDGCSLVLLRLETGRTHQIRVHMSYLGHPLLGDTLYAAFPDSPVLDSSVFASSALDSSALDSPALDSPAQIKRQALHSCRLYFTHPITGAAIDLTAPLPSDMALLFPQETLSRTEHVPLTVPRG